MHSDDAAIDQENVKEAINAVLERWCMQDDDLTQTVSKINRKIKQAVTDTLAKPHQITGPARWCTKNRSAVMIVYFTYLHISQRSSLLSGLTVLVP